MARRVKIRKKKSFMFTTRHYSFMSIMGILLAVICILTVFMMVMQSYRNAGSADAGLGGAGLFSAGLNIIGIICGLIGTNERDAYVWPAIVAIALNSAMILAWIVMMIFSAVS